MSLYDEFMADTVGTVFRAATGDTDPWTKDELVDQEASGNVAAGADPSTAQSQAETDITNALSTFSLGGGDSTGADPSQASGINIPGVQALKDTYQSLTNDDGSGCGLTNLGGCLPSVTIPTWVYWAAGAAGVVFILWLLRPYVGLAAREA